MNTNSTQQEMPVPPGPTTPPQPEMTAPPQPAMVTPAQSAQQQPAQQGVSEDTKTLITVLLLIFVFPIGLIVMFFWPKWKWWVKLLIALPVLFFGFILMGAVLLAVNPSEQIEKAECVTACEESGGTDCVEMCAMPVPDDSSDTLNYDESESVMMEAEPVN